MLTLIVTEKGGTPKRMDFDKDEVTVGRVPGNDIVLNKGNVSKRHSRVVKQDGRFFVVDLKSTNGTYLNGRRITTPSVIRPGDKVYIGDFVIMVDMGDGSAMEMAAQDMGDMPMEGGPNDGDANDGGQDDGGYDEMPPAPEPQAPPPGFGPPPMGPPRPAAMTSPGPGPGGPQPIGGRGPLQPPQGPPRSMSNPGAPMSGPPGPMGGPNLGGPPGPMGGPNLGGPPGPMGGPPGPMGGPPGPMGGPNLGGPPGPMGGPNLGGPPRPVALPPNGPLGHGGPPGPMPGGPMQGGPGPMPGGPMQGGPGPMPGGPMQGGPMHGGPSPLGPSPLGGPPGPRPLGPPPGGPGPMQGGPMQGGPMQGGPMQGGPMQGGPMQGGPMQGGSMPGGPMQGGPGPMPGGPMQGGPGPMPGGPMQGGPGSAMRSSGPGLAPMNRGPMPQPGQGDGSSGPMGGPQLVPVSLGAPPGMELGPPEPQREAIPSLETYGTGEPQQTPPLGVQRAIASMDAPPMPAPMPPLAPPPGPAPMPSQGNAPRPLAPAPMAPPTSMAPTAPAAPPAPAVGPSPARPSQPMPEARSGNEYADALAHVVRTAKQRGVEAAYGDDAARQRARSTVEQSARSLAQLPAGASHERLASDALAELVGLGAFEAVLEDGAIEAASVDHQGRVTTLRGGAHTAGSHWFSSPSAAAECAERLLRAHGIDRAGRPSLHAALGDGTRVLALFPPLVHGGAVVQLERHPRPTTLSDLTARGLLPPQALNVLINALASRRNIIVAGARGSGRTAMLSALLASLPHDDRAVVIEDRDELSRARRDALSVRADGDWSAAVSAGLSLRAGRVVYGEAVEACAKAFVAGLTTGVEGAMIAVAAPTGPIALARLASTATQDKWLTQQDAAARILAARPLLIETARLGDGQCRVVGLGEVRPGNDGSLQVAPMFALRIDGPDGSGNLALQLVPAGAY